VKNFAAALNASAIHQYQLAEEVAHTVIIPRCWRELHLSAWIIPTHGCLPAGSGLNPATAAGEVKPHDPVVALTPGPSTDVDDV
jgi:hypothetical protein